MGLPPSTSVSIVGGGPVGLSAAIGLRHFGVECLVIEKHPSTSRFPKGRAVTARTMEIFRQWGLEDAITAAGLPRDEPLCVCRRHSHHPGLPALRSG